MKVVRHQTVDRTEELFACGDVEDDFAECGVKVVVEPALLTVGNGQGPENDGVGLVERTRKTREIKGPIALLVVHVS